MTHREETVFSNTSLKERQKGREGEKEDVSSYWMTQRGNSLLKHLIGRKMEATRK